MDAPDRRLPGLLRSAAPRPQAQGAEVLEITLATGLDSLASGSRGRRCERGLGVWVGCERGIAEWFAASIEH